MVESVDSQFGGTERARLRPRVQAALDVVGSIQRERAVQDERDTVLKSLSQCRSERDEPSVRALQACIANLSAGAADLCRARGDLREAQSLIASVDRELKVWSALHLLRGDELTCAHLLSLPLCTCLCATKVGEALQSFATDISPETSPIGQSSNLQDSIFEQTLAVSAFRNDQSTQLSIGPGFNSDQRQSDARRNATSQTKSRLAQEFLGQLEVVYKNSVRDGVFSDLTIMLEKASEVLLRVLWLLHKATFVLIFTLCLCGVLRPLGTRARLECTRTPANCSVFELGRKLGSHSNAAPS